MEQKVAIAGATGAVGTELIKLLEQTQLPRIRTASSGLQAIGRQETPVPGRTYRGSGINDRRIRGY